MASTKDARSYMARKSVGEIKPFPEKLITWEGTWVYLKYMTGPSISGEDVDEIVRAAPQVRSGVFFLHEVSSGGVLVSRHPQTDTEDFGAFIPWGSVLSVVGPQPGETEAGETEAGETEEPSSTELTR